jgi:hypothetical protein
MYVNEDAIPVSADSIGERYELPCPVCGFSPVAVITETGRGTEAYLTEMMGICEHPDPPAGEAVYYLHITEHP